MPQGSRLLFLIVFVLHVAPVSAGVIAPIELGWDGTGREINDEGRIVAQTGGFWTPGGLFTPWGTTSVGRWGCPEGSMSSYFVGAPVSGLSADGRILGYCCYLWEGDPPELTLCSAATWDENGYDYTPLESLWSGFDSLYGMAADGDAAGRIVGQTLNHPGELTHRPVIWNDHNALPLELPNFSSYDPLFPLPFPVRINSRGYIIGNTSAATTPHAAIWTPVSTSYALFSFLGKLPGGATSHAHDIDSAEMVVGSSDDGSGTEVAVVWQPNGSGWDVTALPVPFSGGSCSEATAVSDRGEIAGNCTTSTGHERGVIWRQAAGSWFFVFELVPLPGHDDSAVFGLNEKQQAVGRSGDASSPRAVRWEFAPSIPPVPSLSPVALALLGFAIVAVALLLSSGRGRLRKRARSPRAGRRA